MDNIYKAFILYAKKFGYTDSNIWRANQNGGPINPPCVILSISNSISDSTNTTEDVYNSTLHTYSHTVKRISSLLITMDFYGENSFDNANSAAVAFEDLTNFDIFKENGIIPIESSERQQLPFVAQDSLDYDRFQINCLVNYNPTFTQSTDFATEIDPIVERVQNK
jgi:hypothetical protein